jgi:hypothetical protein
MKGRTAHHAGTLLMSVLMVAIGVALIVQALSGHGGALSGRTLAGVLFVAAGIGRGYVETRRGRGT